MFCSEHSCLYMWTCTEADSYQTWWTWGLFVIFILNEDKTEALLVTTSCCDKELPVSIQMGHSIVPFIKSVINHSVNLDSKLSIKEHINKCVRWPTGKLWRISSIRQYLTDDEAKTLVKSLILSSLYYGDCLLAAVPDCLLHKFQEVQNASACLILKSAQRGHSESLLIHGLQISDRIKYELSWMHCHAITVSTPQYLVEFLQAYTQSCTLQSAADAFKFKITLCKKKHSGQRSLSYHGPVTRNNLPFFICHSKTYTSFKSQLKIYLFSQTFQ